MNNHRSLPAYLKIKSYILENIESGEWAAGAKIPSEAQLVTRFGTSRMTANRAVRELAMEGKLRRKQGAGTFVAAPKPRSAFLEITSIAQEIESTGGTHSSEVHLLCEEKALPALAAKMKILPYAPTYHSVLVHKYNEIPIQLADRYINPVIAPDYLEQDFTAITPAEYLLQIAPDFNAEHIIEALIPEAWIRLLLKINEAEPCLVLSRTTWANDEVATISKFYYPGSRYSLGA